MKILVAEDDRTNAMILERILAKAGYVADVVSDGVEALKRLEQESYDVLLTDWMMPRMDGIDLILRVRADINPLPVIIMITALGSPESQSRALESGADDFIAKPCKAADMLKCLGNALDRKHQPIPKLSAAPPPHQTVARPPFVGVVIAASTGGPMALKELFRMLPTPCPAAFFVVLHGPAWMLQNFVTRLQCDTKLRVNLAESGSRTVRDQIYLAPGERHLCIMPESLNLQINDDPEENFVRPSADPLFRSAAVAFGPSCIAVVLTGMGHDGAQGTAQIAAMGGVVLAQDPKTAVAPSMPQTIVSAGLASEVLTLSDIGKAISRHVMRLSG